MEFQQHICLVAFSITANANFLIIACDFFDKFFDRCITGLSDLLAMTFVDMNSSIADVVPFLVLIVKAFT